jgi:hypothetical protein
MSDDRDAILTLMNAYCFAIDAGDLEGFARLFERGRWVVVGDSRGGDFGSVQVLRTLRNVILYDGRPLTKHVMSNAQIEVDPAGKRATAQCYVTVFQAVPPDFPLQPIFAGHYHDAFEKIDGIWAFTERRISPDLVGDLSRHRADMARP